MSNLGVQEPKPSDFNFGTSLFIKGIGLNFEEISRTLGLDPSKVVISQKGKRYGHAQTLCDFDGWYYSPQMECTRTLDEHIVALWDVVRPHAAFLRELKQKYEVHLDVNVLSRSLIFKEYYTRFAIDHRNLGLFTEIGLPLRVNVNITERFTKK